MPRLIVPARRLFHASCTCFSACFPPVLDLLFPRGFGRARLMLRAVSAPEKTAKLRRTN
jgi:hypothetical protein